MRLGVLFTGALIAVLGFVPTPYWIIAPGSAVDLSAAVAVDGHTPGTDRFYLTDVAVQRATALTVPLGLLPGARLVREETLIPRGVPLHVYDRVLSEAMDESQGVAAIVAERAAGLSVAEPIQRIYIGDVLPASNAAAVLRVGDEILTIRGKRVTAVSQVLGLISPLRPGTNVVVEVRRAGSVVALPVKTTGLPQGTRLGVALETHLAQPQLPVPVRFNVGNVAGSSGGLMFALQIYGALRGDRRRPGIVVAGTGTIASDGSVGAIEGTEQKLIAAKRAGARIFFVPRANAAEIAAEREVRVVPVGSFRDALAALKS